MKKEVQLKSKKKLINNRNSQVLAFPSGKGFKSHTQTGIGLCKRTVIMDINESNERQRSRTDELGRLRLMGSDSTEK